MKENQLNMDSESHDHHQLNIFFIPFLQQAHMIAMVDVARLFATRPGVKVNIITTTHNAISLRESIDRDISSGLQIQLHILKFPSAKVGLPEGIENFKFANSGEMYAKIGMGTYMLQPDMEQVLRDNKPDCIITDSFYPWTTDFAVELGCPRIVFIGTGFFSHCTIESIWRHKPQETVTGDTETIVIPELPDKIEMTRLQLPDHIRTRNGYTDLQDVIKKAEMRSYGTIVSSFYELEPAYADHLRNLGRKVWQFGPTSLAIQREDKQVKHECLTWLDSMKPKSVVYISFGSLVRFTIAQLIEIASALEASGHPFIWVVREPEDASDEEAEEKWLPEELKKKGMIIKGWVPQVAILEHPAIGGFLTHCGWNSVLETVGTGVPMIVWPLYAEQFYNEKLVVQVLKIGVAVGVEKFYSLLLPEGEVRKTVNREKIEKAVTWLMNGGHKAEEMRKRVKELSEKAKRAVEEGGSSYTCLSNLIEELRNLRCNSNNSISKSS